MLWSWSADCCIWESKKCNKKKNKSCPEKKCQKIHKFVNRNMKQIAEKEKYSSGYTFFWRNVCEILAGTPLCFYLQNMINY